MEVKGLVPLFVLCDKLSLMITRLAMIRGHWLTLMVCNESRAVAIPVMFDDARYLIIQLL